MTSHRCHITPYLKVPKEATDCVSHADGETFSGVIGEQIF